MNIFSKLYIECFIEVEDIDLIGLHIDVIADIEEDIINIFI